jgi:hypothetical protein
MIAVKSDGFALAYVDNQTELICMAAVEHDGLALQFVLCQTEPICMAAVTSDGRALAYVHNKTSNICISAIINNGCAIEYIDSIDENQYIYLLWLSLYKSDDWFDNGCIFDKVEWLVNKCNISTDHIQSAQLLNLRNIKSGKKNENIYQ